MVGDSVDSFHRLFGDFDANKTVNIFDLLIKRAMSTHRANMARPALILFRLAKPLSDSPESSRTDRRSAVVPAVRHAEVGLADVDPESDRGFALPERESSVHCQS